MFAVALFMVCAPMRDAQAQTVTWGAPTGTLGWCTVVAAGTTECFSNPTSACKRQFDVYASSGNTFWGYLDTDRAHRKMCSWGSAGGPAPTSITYECGAGYAFAFYFCVPVGELFQSKDCNTCANNGAKPEPSTPFPINILTGNKTLHLSDFRSASSSLAWDATFNSLPFMGSQVIARPAAMANFAPSLIYELHLSSTWDSSGIVSILTPEGGVYRFVKSGTAIVPYTDSTYPVANTDYKLQFTGTWPGTLPALKTAKSTWTLTDQQSRIWYFETSYDPDSGKYDIARPVRMVDQSGEELAFERDISGIIQSITDGYGRSIDLTWTMVNGRSRAISTARLPDGTHIDYIYDSLASGSTEPDRLARVERRDASNTLLDKRSYLYQDSRFPNLVTDVRDRDDVVRWSVTYDGQGRATQSTGPSSVQSFTVAYGTIGSSFTRTVTNPLGKQTVYTFVKGASDLNARMVSEVDQASTNSPAKTVAYGYDASTFLNSTTDGESRVGAFTRDTSGRVTQQIEANSTAQARTTGVTWHSSVNRPTQIAQSGLTTDFTLTAGSSAGPITYAVTQAYAYGGAAQTYTVAPGLSAVTVELWGGGGGNAPTSSLRWSGAGGYVRGTFAVTPGDVLKIEVAGGGQGGVPSVSGGAGGWPDGGGGGRSGSSGGGGGGSTRFYINNVLKAVAGGGGGVGYGIASAGAAGGTAGQSSPSGGGTGGTQSAAGVDSNDLTNANKSGRSTLAFPGVQRTGGWGANTGNITTTTSDAGGGGGGGYWGGGGGGGGGGASGGGGSSWLDPGGSALINFGGGNGATPYSTPTGQPNVAAGVQSNYSIVRNGGDGYAILKLR